jgi:hypothetical protein
VFWFFCSLLTVPVSVVVQVGFDAGFFLASVKRSVACEDDAIGFGILVPDGDEGCELFGIVLGEVAGLAGVVLEVEQLPNYKSKMSE